MTLTTQQKEEIKFCIRDYEKRGLDWSLPVEFMVVKGNGHLRALRWWTSRLPLAARMKLSLLELNDSGDAPGPGAEVAPVVYVAGKQK